MKQVPLCELLVHDVGPPPAVTLAVAQVPSDEAPAMAVAAQCDRARANERVAHEAIVRAVAEHECVRELGGEGRWVLSVSGSGIPLVLLAGIRVGRGRQHQVCPTRFPASGQGLVHVAVVYFVVTIGAHDNSAMATRSW